MTVAERIVSYLLEDEPDPAFVRDVARAGMVGAWLHNAESNDIGDVRFGFEISTGDEQNVIENAIEIIGREPDEADWRRLKADFYYLERNALKIIQGNGVQCSEEGHSDNALVGSACITSIPDAITGDYWVPGLRGLRFLLAAQSEGLNTSSGSLNRYNKDNQLYAGVSDIGRQLIDVSIRFFDTEKLNLDEWEDILHHRPQLWVQEEPVTEKLMLDFNRFIGSREPSGVYMSRVDGTPIYSAKCPGCKNIHGNFRTWEEASGNRMCKGCVADFVDKTRKANETGNYRSLLKKNYGKKRLH